MAAYLSVHDVKKIAAHTVWAPDNKCSPHLSLDFEGETSETRGSVLFYINDAVLNARLIEAINNIVAERRAELASARHFEAA